MDCSSSYRSGLTYSPGALQRTSGPRRDILCIISQLICDRALPTPESSSPGFNGPSYDATSITRSSSASECPPKRSACESYMSRDPDVNRPRPGWRNQHLWKVSSLRRRILSSELVILTLTMKPPTNTYFQGGKGAGYTLSTCPKTNLGTIAHVQDLLDPGPRE